MPKMPSWIGDGLHAAVARVVPAMRFFSRSVSRKEKNSAGRAEALRRSAESVSGFF
jgi:hypothetical protein